MQYLNYEIYRYTLKNEHCKKQSYDNLHVSTVLQVHSLLSLGVYANRMFLRERIKKQKWIETRNKTFLFLFRCDIAISLNFQVY